MLTHNCHRSTTQAHHKQTACRKLMMFERLDQKLTLFARLDQKPTPFARLDQILKECERSDPFVVRISLEGVALVVVESIRFEAQRYIERCPCKMVTAEGRKGWASVAADSRQTLIVEGDCIHHLAVAHGN